MRSILRTLRAPIATVCAAGAGLASFAGTNHCISLLVHDPSALVGLLTGTAVGIGAMASVGITVEESLTRLTTQRAVKRAPWEIKEHDSHGKS